MPSQPVWLYQGNRVWCTRVSSARQRKKKKKGKGRGGGWFKRVMENDKRLLVNELRCPRPLLPLSPLPLFLRCPSSSLKLSEHASAVSLLESGELHYIKEINNYFPTVFYFLIFFSHENHFFLRLCFLQFYSHSCRSSCSLSDTEHTQTGTSMHKNKTQMPVLWQIRTTRNTSTLSNIKKQQQTSKSMVSNLNQSETSKKTCRAEHFRVAPTVHTAAGSMICGCSVSKPSTLTKYITQ